MSQSGGNPGNCASTLWDFCFRGRDRNRRGERERERRGRKRSPASITATVTGDGDRMRSGAALQRCGFISYVIRTRSHKGVGVVSVPIIRELINRQVLHNSNEILTSAFRHRKKVNLTCGHFPAIFLQTFYPYPQSTKNLGTWDPIKTDSVIVPNRSQSRQFVATYVYQATLPRHLAFQLFHEHTNKHTNKREGDSL